tara:strand:+ start:792 stop:1556 length:765 start_codon:yes stop_codon:yes gene_type:complete
MSAITNNLVVGLIFGSFVTAAVASPFDTSTAEILDAGEFSVGVFAPLTYGISDDLQVSTHPISAYWNGNFALKKAWGSSGDWSFASRHGFSYPTRLLSAFAREGTGGILAPDLVIPHIVAMDTRGMMTRDMGESTRFTLGARVTLAASFGESEWGSIDMPLVYSRTAALHNGVSMNVSAVFDGEFTDSTSWLSSTTAWYLPGTVGVWSLEQTLAAAWESAGGFSAQLGTIFVVGGYDYGTNWHLLPKFDLGWRF